MATNQPARGGAAESVSEFVKRRNREQAARGQAKAAAHQAYGDALRAKLNQDFPTQRGTASPNYKHLQPNYFETPAAQIGHPGLAESFVPVWGPTREALADLADGKPRSAAFNAGLAVLDATGVGIAEKALARGGSYAIKGAIGKSAAQAKWKTVRKTMGDLEMLKPYPHGHHWFIPQKGWGTKVPNVIKNHPANIMGMPSAEIHGRLHGRYKGKPEFGLLGKYWHGTPHLLKIATGSTAGHTIAAARTENRRK